MKVHNLVKKYHYIKKNWEKNKDPKFPNGESYRDVNIRINNFLKG